LQVKGLLYELPVLGLQTNKPKFFPQFLLALLQNNLLIAFRVKCFLQLALRQILECFSLRWDLTISHQIFKGSLFRQTCPASVQILSGNWPDLLEDRHGYALKSFYVVEEEKLWLDDFYSVQHLALLKESHLLVIEKARPQIEQGLLCELSTLNS